MLHNSWNQNIFAVADTVYFKLLSFHVFIYEHRIFDSGSQDDFHVFLYVGVAAGNNHILTAKYIAWTHEDRVGDSGCSFEGFCFCENCKAAWAFNVEAVAKLFEAFAVFGKVNCVGAGSKNLYALTVQELSKFNRCTTTKGNYYAERFFYGKYSIFTNSK